MNSDTPPAGSTQESEYSMNEHDRSPMQFTRIKQTELSTNHPPLSER